MKRWLSVLILLLCAAALARHFVRPAKVVNDPPRAGAIVAFGDSLTSGAGAGPGKTYPDQLAKLIGRPVVNAGIGGETIADAAKRLDRDVLALKPGIVIVLLGGNDLLRGGDMDAGMAVLERMIAKIQRSGAMAVVVGLESAIPFAGVNKRYRALAGRTGALFVPDILSGILGERKLMSDQVHPNSEGYRIMAERIAAALQGHLP